MTRLALVAATIAAAFVTACGAPPPRARTVDMVKIEQPAANRPARAPSPSSATPIPAAIGFDPPPAPASNSEKKKPQLPPIGIVCDGA